MTDSFDKETRSRIMAAIHSKNTLPEVRTFRALRQKGIYFQRHYRGVSGSPDIAVPSSKKAVFIDGDFWHGFRYPLWKKRLNSSFWREKIEHNRRRDKLCHQRLRRKGWKVLRIWEHQLERDFNKTISRVATFLE